MAFVRSRRRDRALEPAEATAQPVAVPIDVTSTDHDDAGRSDPDEEGEPPKEAAPAIDGTDADEGL